MQHITDDIVGKRVVGPDGERIGKVTGVQDGKAMLKAETGVAAEMEDALSGADDETLSVTADQVVEVTDEEVHVSRP
ncbi:hypothetical protein NDI76_05145 [Halogeometricum sp. S1BR25-6]|uniref:PRC-barrel domain-containing protein n=1 Tax=Halogeometricum salsisoli TaxID=2950536 RepID=A0ABU2GBD3_9EURY|nr:hypothetical protein [Halogeometricum sp. S1BR25-6]MDS0298121.1 hypothetical protein [Halogeometricum sp. S1BR25-6]